MKNFLSSGNEKLARSGIFSWGIPAYKSADGTITCPGALDCIRGCYAAQGRYVMPNVKTAQENRLALSRSPEFVDMIDGEIKSRLVRKLRVHDSGDFYSLSYLQNWLEIARRNPKTLFYAYTKMLPLLDRVTPPGNFVFIKSTGGRWDSQINPETDRHARVFDSIQSLKKSGYSDVTKLDSRAWGKNPRIGLVYHGAKSKAWNS
jgi:hypothetical protein